MSFPSFLRISLVLALSGALSACFLSGPSIPMIAGEYTGQIAIQGQGINGNLSLTQEIGALTATFAAPSFGLVAEGTGTVGGDGSIDMTLSYDLQCPGTARLEGEVSADGRRISGRLEAEDCTGPVAGTFEFMR